jgi:hypothetical protein
LLSEYGFDLVEEWETVSARRLWVLIEGLPADCAVWRDEVWTREQEFLAGLIEMADIASWRTVAALGGEMKGEPIYIERPYEEAAVQAERPKKITTDTREIARFFAQHN